MHNRLINRQIRNAKYLWKAIRAGADKLLEALPEAKAEQCGLLTLVLSYRNYWIEVASTNYAVRDRRFRWLADCNTAQEVKEFVENHVEEAE